MLVVFPFLWQFIFEFHKYDFLFLLEMSKKYIIGGKKGKWENIEGYGGVFRGGGLPLDLVYVLVGFSHCFLRGKGVSSTKNAMRIGRALM